MIPKSKRLTRNDFSKFEKRNTIRGNYFDLTTSPSKETKFACIVAKKRVKLAVDRNKIKRKIYHALNEATPRNPHFVIIYPKQNASSAPQKEIIGEIKRVFDTL